MVINLKKEGVEALAEALKVNSSLIGLDLKNNEIKNEGAEALAEALKNNSSLTELDFFKNN